MTNGDESGTRGRSSEEDYRDGKRGVEKVEGMDEGWTRGGGGEWTESEF